MAREDSQDVRRRLTNTLKEGEEGAAGGYVFQGKREGEMEGEKREEDQEEEGGNGRRKRRSRVCDGVLV